MTIELPTQEQVQAQFDAASKVHVSPCMWIPPEWKDVKIREGRGFLPDNSRDNDRFQNPEATENALKRISDGEAKMPPKGPEDSPDKESWVNPFADFSHIDDSEYPNKSIDLVKAKVDPSGDARKLDKALTDVAGMFRKKRDVIVEALDGDEQLFEKSVRVLQADILAKPGEVARVATLVRNPGEIHDAVLKVVDGHVATFEKVVDVLQGSGPGFDLLDSRHALNRLQRIVGGESPGMKRLALVFEWALYRTTVLMNDLNKALKRANKGDYEQARINYIHFLRDLDDHEPQLSNRPVNVKDKKARSAYGRALKWACIEPVIFTGQIVGTRVVIKWNPHSSSNGVPIPHDP